jgi:hypothetical protein
MISDENFTDFIELIVDQKLLLSPIEQLPNGPIGLAFKEFQIIRGISVNSDALFDQTRQIFLDLF